MKTYFKFQDNDFDWLTIGALNSVSALAQIGQFGIAFVVLPVWLAQQGLDPTQLGMFAASLWLGQLPGLALAPWLSKHFGPRKVILAGLLCTVIALFWIAVSAWPFWLIGGTLAGLGLGLRWIGLEPWLYNIAPAHARGRLVGFQETMIAIAPIVGPLLAGYFSLHGSSVFWIGTVFTVAALVPLAFAQNPVAIVAAQPIDSENVNPVIPLRDGIFKQGVIIALLGGMMEAAVSGLFAPFAQGHGMSVSQTADLLAVFGLGGLLFQYCVGWLADHHGVGISALSCAISTILVTAALTLPLSFPLVVIAIFLLGGFITAFLTLALIAGTSTTSGSMARNLSMLAMLYTVSAIAGPLIAGAAMKATHSDALMWFTATAAMIMLFLLGWTASPRLQRSI